MIGAAANEAARIEGLTKTVGRRLVVSAPVAAAVDGDRVSLGRHELRGVADPPEIFALADVG